MNFGELQFRVYYAAKEGMDKYLYTLLSDVDETTRNELLNERMYDGKIDHCTPLIMAARNGYDKVVRMLLTKFQPDIEQDAVIRNDGYIVDGATALWCAACRGHLSVVKTLVKAGANINHPTKSNSTPLRAACFDGRLDIVQYLIANGANLHIANRYNNTCLMMAAYKGHTDIVTYLLQNGANPNDRATCGATALHFAAESGHLDVVKELVTFDAKFYPNDNDMTPVKSAAERTREQIVEFLLAHPSITKEEIIEALELLGASFANDKENYNIMKAYEYMHRSMTLRFTDPDNPIPKHLLTPIPAYENWVECQNLRELEAIQGNTNSLHMEALTVRERILGTSNPEMPHPIIYRGAVFADNARFDRCIALWLHALKIRQKIKLSVTKDLLRFAQVFSQMIHVGVVVTYSQITAVLDSAVTELGRNKEKLNDCLRARNEAQAVELYEEVERNMTTTLYILSILTKLKEKCSEEEQFNIHKMVFELTQLNVTFQNGQSLLHLACNTETHVDDFHCSHIIRFPSAEVVNLLITCGADVNAMDNERNTPLHIIVVYHRAITDYPTLHKIIIELLENGAHVDTVNMRGETPEAACTTGIAEIILKTRVRPSLKCLAANTVAVEDIPYQGMVPMELEYFIELHGRGMERWDVPDRERSAKRRKL